MCCLCLSLVHHIKMDNKVFEELVQFPNLVFDVHDEKESDSDTDSDIESDSEDEGLVKYYNRYPKVTMMFRLAKDYNFIRQLSDGRNNIYLTDDQKVIKIKHIYQNSIEHAVNVRILTILQGIVGIPKLEAYYKMGKTSAIVTPFLKHCKIEPEHLFAVTKQLITIIKALHDRKVIHRDIKPSNIIWDGTQIYLIDFDMSTFTTFEHDRFAGTDDFAAPEMVSIDRGRNAETYNESVDLYSAGVTLLLLKNDIFENDIDEHLLKVLRKKNRKCTDTISEIIHGLLQNKPSQRPKLSEILERLEKKTE